MRRVILLLSSVALTSCAWTPIGTSDPGTKLHGAVSFGDDRSIQASMKDVAYFATVSLISARTHESLYTTLTDKDGGFLLNLPGWKPDPAEVYYLEAYKGLGDNRAGNSSVRVRTIGRYTPSGWTSITGGSPGSLIMLTTTTTAISILASHFGSSAVPPLSLIGKINLGIPDLSLPAPRPPDTFTAAGTGITNPQFQRVYNLVSQSLAIDGDPFERIQYDGNIFTMKSYTAAGISAAIPMAAPVGATITLYGANFDAEPAGNTVSFNGVMAVPDTATPQRMTIKVPAGATSGPISVTSDNGTSQLAGFTVIPNPGGSLSAN